MEGHLKMTLRASRIMGKEVVQSDILIPISLWIKNVSGNQNGNKLVKYVSCSKFQSMQ